MIAWLLPLSSPLSVLFFPSSDLLYATGGANSPPPGVAGRQELFHAQPAILDKGDTKVPSVTANTIPGFRGHYAFLLIWRSGVQEPPVTQWSYVKGFGNLYKYIIYSCMSLKRRTKHFFFPSWRYVLGHPRFLTLCHVHHSISSGLPIPWRAERILSLSDFREKFTSCSLWLLEVKSVGIFAISSLRTKIL